MTKQDEFKEKSDKWDVQLRKGTLELVILAALKERKLYGLELLKLLQSFETMKITEGTMYPLLDRLKRDGVVDAIWHQEGQSRPRKYYHLTEYGEEKLSALTLRWRKSVEDIEFLLNNPGPQEISPRGK
jgi:PadR family transcriptional regulator PadR